MEAMRERIRRAMLSVAALLWSGALLACPLCADNLSNDVYGKQPTQLGRGFFWSILFMMALPFATVATVGLRIYLARRRRPAPKAETSS